jgi:hypothetical protein
LLLARSGRTLALVPAELGFLDTSLPYVAADPRHVVLASVSGAPISEFTTTEEVTALALTPRYVFALVVGHNKERIEVHDPRTGRLLRLVRPGIPAWAQLAAAGATVVYHDYDEVWSLDGATGRRERLTSAPVRLRRVAAPWAVVTVAMWRGAAVWVEQALTPHAVGDTNNPADFVSRVRAVELR